MPAGARRLGWGAIAASGVALVFLWRLLPAGSPPIYDGLCTPDPYRLLGQTPAPASASMSYPGTAFPAAEVQTGETPTQAQVLMMASTFTTASPVTISVTPEALPVPAPAGTVHDGNAYRITAVSGGQNVEPEAGMPVTVSLRGTGVSSALTMYVRSGAGWRPLRTFNLGCGFKFEAVSTTMGDFALFRAASGSTASGGFPVAVVVIILAVLVVAATLGLARLSVRRRR